MEDKEFFELTNPQKSIWYTEQFYSGTTVNNICTSGTVYGEINENLLKQLCIRGGFHNRSSLCSDNDLPNSLYIFL